MRALLTVLAVGIVTPVLSQGPENIALGAEYTMTDPSYALCTDEDDAVQLTDGIRTEGHFWMQPTTVGWSGGAMKFITIDLGEVHPISGVSFSTAAGVAEVEWPADLLVFVSDDGAAWHMAVDLLDLSAEIADPPPEGYATHEFRTEAMRTHGRYVQIVAVPDGSYLFVDEIEVYFGEDAWLAEALPGEPAADVSTHMAGRRFNGLVKAQLRRDLKAVAEDLAGPGLGEADRETFTVAADAMAERIAEMDPVPVDGFRAILPMTELEREIFRLQAAVWRAQGKTALRAWKSHRWDPLSPSAEPSDAEPLALSVATLSGEHRADVLNFTNAHPEDVTVRLNVTGLPGGTDPDYMSVHEVLTVGTRRFVAVSSALPLAGRDGDSYTVTVPSGMTKQVWFALNPRDVAAGTYAGAVEASASTGETLSVAFALRIYPIEFPESTSLLLGGWSYTDGGGGRAITPANRDAVVTHLRERFVNTPWATAAALPRGTYDDDGNLATEPNTARFDEWVEQWPDAEVYMVFAHFGDYGTLREEFDGTPIGTPLADVKIGNWIRFWADHLRAKGMNPGQLGLLLIDEPHDEDQYRVVTALTRAVRKAEPEVVLWVDPQPSDDGACLEMMAEMDALVAYRKQWLRSGDWFGELFLDQRRQGRELGFYSCDGPARRFDPFSYYLLQAWDCFRIGARWAQFWAFGDTSGADVWNEYATDGRGPYTPLYIDDEGVTGSKYMEAIREGVEDYEILTMLAARIAEMEAAGEAGDELAAAKAVLGSACERVLAAETEDNYTWDEEKDRSAADVVRVEVLEALVELE